MTQVHLSPNEREKELLVRLLHYAKAYDDACPEIGFPPTLGILLISACKGIIELGSLEIEEIIDRYNDLYGSN